jgi:hypothetical protein
MKCKGCPRRKVHAKGLCGKCYQRRYRVLHPDWDQVCWQRQKQTPEKELLKAARRRARQRNRPCTIALADIVIPKRCPILGVVLEAGIGLPTEQSPSLDEIVVGRGYVVGNMQVISRKANTMKSDATPEELLRFANWIRRTYGN